MLEVSSVCLIISDGPFNFSLGGWSLFLRIFMDRLLLPGWFLFSLNLEELG